MFAPHARVPLAVALQFVRIACVQAAENDGLAVGGHKVIALHADVTGLRKDSERKQNAGQAAEKEFCQRGLYRG
jgi:hypothetical protein